MSISDSTGFRAGFAALAGAPNVGKSTLLNRMIGEKISIISAKPQTTRNRIVGVVHGDNFQIAFLDTPGIHRSDKVFNRRIVEVALAAMDEVDLVLAVVDASDPDPQSEEMMVERLRQRRPPAVLALNKIDRVAKPRLLQQIDGWAKAYPFAEIVPISALQGTQVPELLTALRNLIPEGPPIFPEDALTDMPERFIAAEMVREKIFAHTGREVPYGTAVTIDLFSEETDIIHIHAIIHVERDSQKGIIIGKGGSMLKMIGTEARQDLENLVGTKVFLKLTVRVEKNWTRDPRGLRKLGY